MDGLSHEEAVGVLKATPETVDLKVEKGAINKASHSPQQSEADIQVHTYTMSVLGNFNTFSENSTIKNSHALATYKLDADYAQ